MITLPRAVPLNTPGGNPNPEQLEVYHGDMVLFQSYGTKIAVIDWAKEVLVLTKYWNYSRTTSKYLYQFLREHGFEVSTAKDIKAYLEDGEISNERGTFKCTFLL